MREWRPASIVPKCSVCKLHPHYCECKHLPIAPPGSVVAGVVSVRDLRARGKEALSDSIKFIHVRNPDGGN